jgi:hypothetical protein
MPEEKADVRSGQHPVEAAALFLVLPKFVLAPVERREQLGALPLLRERVA